MSGEATAPGSNGEAAPRTGLWTAEHEERLVAWAETISDWLNPILVKETRQSLKSWTFLMTFSLLLLASWLISVFGVLLAGESVYYGRVGAELFFGFFWVLGTAAFLIIPFSSYRSLLTERDQSTFEVLSITTLKPGQIVQGKLLSSCAQLFVFLSALTPFIAFTWLLRGIDVLSIMMTLILATLAGIGLSMICLTLSALFHGRGWGAIQTLFVFAQLFGTFISLTAGLATMGVVGSGAYREWEFWVAVALGLTYYAGYFYLLHTIAVAQLTFDADNRSTPMRVALSGLVLLSLAWIAGVVGFEVATSIRGMSGALQELGLVGASFALGHWALFGLFFVTEPDRLSERTKRGIPRSFLLRMVSAIYFPGGARGMAYILTQMLITLGAAVLMATFDSSPDFDDFAPYVLAMVYVAIYLLGACWLARVGHRRIPGFQANHARVGVLILAAIAALVPAIMEMVADRVHWNTLVHLANPFFVVTRVVEYPAQELPAVLALVVVLIVLLLANCRAMIGGIAEIVMVPRPAPKAVAEPAAIPVAVEGA